MVESPVPPPQTVSSEIRLIFFDMDKDVSCYVAVVPAAIDSGRIIVHFSIRNVKSNISYYWSDFSHTRRRKWACQSHYLVRTDLCKLNQ